MRKLIGFTVDVATRDFDPRNTSDWFWNTKDQRQIVVLFRSSRFFTYLNLLRKCFHLLKQTRKPPCDTGSYILVVNQIRVNEDV